jgi:hypothetical protein
VHVDAEVERRAQQPADQGGAVDQLHAAAPGDQVVDVPGDAAGRVQQPAGVATGGGRGGGADVRLRGGMARGRVRTHRPRRRPPSAPSPTVRRRPLSALSPTVRAVAHRPASPTVRRRPLSGVAHCPRRRMGSHPLRSLACLPRRRIARGVVAPVVRGVRASSMCDGGDRVLRAGAPCSSRRAPSASAHGVSGPHNSWAGCDRHLRRATARTGCDGGAVAGDQAVGRQSSAGPSFVAMSVRICT